MLTPPFRVGAELVLANGTSMRVSATENPDLFWVSYVSFSPPKLWPNAFLHKGIRGASSSFGIVTQYTMQTHEAPDSVIRFAYNFLDADRSPERVADVLHAYQVWGLSAPKEIGMVTNVWQEGKDVEMAGYYMGSQADFEVVIGSLLRVTGPPNTTYVQERGWIAALTEADGGAPLSTKGVQEPHDTFYAKSLVVPSYSPLTKDALTALAEYYTATSTPDSMSWFIQFELWGGGNSAISSVDARGTAYPHRHHHWTCQFYGRATASWPAQGTGYMNGLVDAITNKMQGTRFGAYANYLDPELSEWKEKYYAGNYARLARIQAEVDPQGVFMKAQNIGAPDS
jgi:hypothetical protein